MIYVHVPFCRSFCTYCGFYSEVAPKCGSAEDVLRQEALFAEYSKAVEAEIRTRKDDIERVSASGGADTLYIGGGTPSVLPLHVFERILSSLGRIGFEEFTVEVNPEDIVEKGVEYVKGLLKLGVTRISMGVQSFDDRMLKWMNRRHTVSQAVEAYRILEEAGVRNISVDLIFGLPDMDEVLWRETIDKVLGMSSQGVLPRHISAYQLSVEDGSALEKMISDGKCVEASEDECRRQYDILCETLGKAGYNHYEISNFALPGYEAVHNSAYWRHVPYIGLGPGAHSYLVREDDASENSGTRLQHEETGGMLWREVCGTRKRQWNAPDIDAYVRAGRDGDFAAVQGGETLVPEQIVLEKVMLGLRTAAGVPEDYLRTHCGGRALEEALRCGNLVVLDDGFVRIPEDRFFISDSIISSII